MDLVLNMRLTFKEIEARFIELQSKHYWIPVAIDEQLVSRLNSINQIVKESLFEEISILLMKQKMSDEHQQQLRVRQILEESLQDFECASRIVINGFLKSIAKVFPDKV